jgi:hypothetical protein
MARGLRKLLIGGKSKINADFEKPGGMTSAECKITPAGRRVDKFPGIRQVFSIQSYRAFGFHFIRGRERQRAAALHNLAEFTRFWPKVGLPSIFDFGLEDIEETSACSKNQKCNCAQLSESKCNFLQSNRRPGSFLTRRRKERKENSERPVGA